jgi:hypothetical protein
VSSDAQAIEAYLGTVRGFSSRLLYGAFAYPTEARLLVGSSACYDTTPDPARNVGGHSRVRRETLGVNPTTFGIRRDSRN